MGLMDTLFGGSKQKSSSDPFSMLNARLAWQAAPQYIGAEPTGETPGFQWDMYSPERWAGQRWQGERLTGGDYDRLEEQLAATPLRRLQQQKEDAQARFQAQMRKTGMGEDPSAYKLWEETGETPYAQAMGDVLSGAAGQRYNMQLGELSELNRLGLSEVQQMNQLGLNEKQAYNQLMTQQQMQMNPARMQQEWLKWSSPRDWWAQKMRLWQTPGKGGTQSSSEGGPGIIPGLSSMFSFNFGGKG